MLRLHLLRHAKTEQFSPTGKDFDRPLMSKGVSQSKELKHLFGSLNSIDHVLCSTSARTRQTLRLIEWDGMPKVQFSDDFYLCSHKALLQTLWTSEYTGDVLIVGHNFGISDLANYFTEGDMELRTGGYIRLAFDVDSWEETSRGMGVIEEEFRPVV